MLLNTLESLVLRNVTVTVVNGGSTVELLRHGPGYRQPQTPEVAISKRHSSQGAKQVFMQPAQRPGNAIADDGGTDAATGTGRSLRLAGVLRRRSAVLVAARRGAKPPAAACLCRIPPARLVASGSEVTSRRSTTQSLAFTSAIAATVDEQLPTVGVVWCKPATRTPPASTRGKGVR
jgi:hypothetical protein